MFWNTYRLRSYSNSNSAANAASRAQSKAESAERRVERLEDKLESLAMACQAMWELLETHTKLTQEHLDQKIEEIDLRDGIHDGRISKTVDTCPQCKRKTSIRRPNCLYCGYIDPQKGTFGQNLP